MAPSSGLSPRETDIDAALRRESLTRRRVDIIEAALFPQVTANSTEWIFRLAEIADRNDLEREVVVIVVSDLAWLARDAGQRLPSEEEWSRCDDPATPLWARLIFVYALGFRLRYDFRFEDLADAAREWLRDFPNDVLIQAFAAFAALGMHSDRGVLLIDRVLQAPNLDMKTRSTCLHALWFASHLDDQAERIIKLSDEMIARGEDNYNTHYWRTFALRRSGRLDEALSSVDRAIRLLPVGMNAVHQDYVRERELITTTQLLDGHVSDLSERLKESLRDEFQEHLEVAKKELKDQSQLAQDVVSRSLLSLVEVLALFVTLAGFLLGSGTVVIRASGFGESFLSISLLLIGSVAFFVLLRTVVRMDRPDRPIVSRFISWATRRAARGRRQEG